MFGVFLRRLVLLIISCFLLLAIYTYGRADISSNFLINKKSITLIDTPPDEGLESLSDAALVVLADNDELFKADTSERLLLLALQKNPSSGRAAASLVSFYSNQGSDKSIELASLASDLWPAHSYTRSRLAAFWLKQERLDKVIDEWNILLVRNPKLYKELFPLLKEVLLGNNSVLMLRFVDTPPRWWNSFFAYLSQELSVSDLRVVYKARVASASLISPLENTYYVRRLLKEGYVHEAHDEWFLSLEPRQMLLGGLVYDGGFEGDKFNQGFGWSFSRSKNPKIKTDITYGIKGRKALHIVLRKKDPINFKHVSQRLLLEPGKYELSLRYRLDTLKTAKGLTWRVRCLDGKSVPVLAETIALTGSQPWTTTKVVFNVPRNCGVQVLRLEALSRFRHDHFFSGSLWFDDIIIRAKSDETE